MVIHGTSVASAVVEPPPSTVPPIVIVSSVPFPTGEEVTSEAQEVRSYIGWDLFPVCTCWDKYARISAGTFSQSALAGTLQVQV